MCSGFFYWQRCRFHRFWGSAFFSSGGYLMKKVFTNVRLTDDDELHDIWVENGRIDKIVPAGRMSFSKNGCEEKDLSGKLVIPPYVEFHIHLDYIYTMNPEVEAGTLFGAINQ